MAEAPGSLREYHIEGPVVDLGPELRQSEGLAGDVRLTRTNRGLLVDGHFETAIDQVCSRCLREIEYPVRLDIEEEALPSIDIGTGLPVDTSAEPDALRLTDHHELELRPVIGEAIQLAEPIAPLCREDCPGLCPVCGEELTDGPHDHPDDVDPRLEALRAFRPDDEAAAGE